MDKKGIAFILVLIFAVIMAISAGAFIFLSSNESRTVRQEYESNRAFYLAEAGAQAAVNVLNQDFINNPMNPSWTDGDINGIDITQGGTVPVPQDRDMARELDDAAQPFYALFPTVTVGDGSYTVSLLNVAGHSDEVYVRSVGTFLGATRTVVVLAKARDVSPWNTAIFGGEGAAAGTLINGNVEICGSVHLLGTGLGAGDFAIDMGGGANILNNYATLPATFSSRVPACPTTLFNGEVVETLESTLRVKNGLVGMSGSATAGEADVFGNAYKETIDAAYVSDGYGGTAGSSSVYSDNGTGHAYDLGDDISFPGLDASHITYLQTNGLVISNAAELSELASITPTSNFTYTDGANTISMNGSGNLTIVGIIYIQGGDLGMAKSGGNTTITYAGSGMIFAEGDGNAANPDVGIDVNLLTTNTFPTQDVLGIMTPGKIKFDEANIDVMGAFYAETEIQVKKQTNIAGTLMSNYIDMGVNVPSVFQIPSLRDNLPDGMVDPAPVWRVMAEDWQEL